MRQSQGAMKSVPHTLGGGGGSGWLAPWRFFLPRRFLRALPSPGAREAESTLLSPLTALAAPSDA